MKKGIDLKRILRLCVTGLWTLALFGCDSSDSSTTVLDEIETQSENQSENQTEKETGSKDGIDPVDADENIQKLDVVIRDFEAGYPDFDNFQSAAYESQTDARRNTFDTWTFPGYADNEDWLARRVIPDGYAVYGCGNQTTPEYGTPMLENSVQAWYGEFANCDGDPSKSMRGFVHELCSDAVGSWETDSTRQCNKRCMNHLWSEKVYFTSDMVKSTLSFPKGEDGKPNLHEPSIVKARDACDNKYFEQWFTDNDLNKRSEGALPLASLDETSMGISYDWNNGGFYPLDSVSDRSEFVSENPNFQNQFGPQSLTIYCPPYDYLYASSQEDNKGVNTASLCTTWLLNGGPRVGGAALDAAMSHSYLGLRHLRNSGFTMVGYAPFKYKKDAGKVFEFTSQGDLWIFIDGVLALDLGGTHLPVSGKVDLKDLASEGHGCHEGDPLEAYCEGRVDDKGKWKDGSWHHIHVFYADRSSDGSTLYLKF